MPPTRRSRRHLNIFDYAERYPEDIADALKHFQNKPVKTRKETAALEALSNAIVFHFQGSCFTCGKFGRVVWCNEVGEQFCLDGPTRDACHEAVCQVPVREH